ncbi:MAG: EpsI family protein [Candidatus Nealsonbacteria bacterium]|nr:EpsI family protein [Candidatus Nealsonbacteria bacterium]
MGVTIRFLVACIVVVLIYATTSMLREGGSAGGVRPLRKDLQELPLSLGEWEGEEGELDPEIFQKTGAVDTIDRTYRDAAGHQVILHSAYWDEYGVGPPHDPHVCYPGAGYRITHEKDVLLDGPNKSTCRARLLTLALDGRVEYVLYWYQHGDSVFVDRAGLRKSRQKWRGRKVWPPVFKVMLQTDGTGAEQAVKRLQSIAEPTFGWTQEL